MRGYGVETELSRELEKVDRGIRIGRLQDKVRELNGGNMLVGGSVADDRSAVVEAFWERVLAFETAPLGTNFAQLADAGIQMPPADDMTDTQLHAKLWEVL